MSDVDQAKLAACMDAISTLQDQVSALQTKVITLEYK